MADSVYFVYTDITDKVISQHITANDSAYLLEADQEIIDLAERRGVDDAVITSTLHFKLKRYGIYYVCMRVCEDNAGLNNTESPIDDKYFLKLDHYKKKLDNLIPQISSSMFTDSELYYDDRIKTTILHRA